MNLKNARKKFKRSLSGRQCCSLLDNFNKESETSEVLLIIDHTVEANQSFVSFDLKTSLFTLVLTRVFINLFVLVVVERDIPDGVRILVRFDSRYFSFGLEIYRLRCIVLDIFPLNKRRDRPVCKSALD